MSEESAGEIHQRLRQLMTKDKLFLDPELTLTDLALKLNIHPNHLSQVINTTEDKTFYDFINTLRIHEFRKRVTIPENRKYTLLALAFDCGFNSKTAFYRNFKTATGQSPTDYLKQQQIALQKE